MALTIVRRIMNRDRIRVGLIGVGRHGARYAQHLVHDLPMASLQAVCRRHPEQGFQLPGADSVTVYGEAHALIADPSVDAIVVVTPPLYSPEICRLAVQARKPLLVEKPLATTVTDARTMVALAHDAGLPFMTAQTLRFDRTIQHMKRFQSSLGRSLELDAVFQIEIRKTAPDHVAGYGKRGALLEIGVHMLDLARFLTGEEVQAVRCTMDHIPPIAPERMASVHLTMTGGTICRMEITRVVSERAGRAIWVGSQGRVEADWMRRRICTETSSGETTADIDIPPSLTVLDTLSAFLQAVYDGTPMPITGEDGCRAVEIAEACYQSAQLGGAPVIVDRWSPFERTQGRKPAEV
ncbi:MAG: Gfo/Idh/MocA family oxidoreductase [Nitrospira sp.]|nr:Gfo/Idh/MocA family oxidoreductase [Nitrospira sp.]